MKTTKSLTDEQIREILMAHGFKIHEGMTDLKPYVYTSARALLAAQAPASDALSDARIKAIAVGVTDELYGQDDSTYNDEDARFYGKFTRAIIAALKEQK